MRQKAFCRTGIVIGQITARDRIAKQSNAGFAPSRGHMRQEDAMLRIMRLQRADQGLDRARFAD